MEIGSVDVGGLAEAGSEVSDLGYSVIKFLFR